MDSKFFKNLQGHKFLEGKPEQIKDYSGILLVRRDVNSYYIAWREHLGQVEGTESFDTWSEAKRYLNDNWRRLVDEEFERQVLIGSEQSGINDTSESGSST